MLFTVLVTRIEQVREDRDAEKCAAEVRAKIVKGELLQETVIDKLTENAWSHDKRLFELCPEAAEFYLHPDVDKEDLAYGRQERMAWALADM